MSYRKVTDPDLAPLMRARIEEWMLKRELSPYAVSVAAGRHRNFLWDFLSGRKQVMAVDALDAIAAVMVVDPKWITGETSDPIPSGSVSPELRRRKSSRPPRRRIAA